MDTGRTAPVSWLDPLVACALLTRIPVGVKASGATDRLAPSAWAWPLVGLLTGGLAGLLALGLLAAGLPAGVAAAAALGLQAMLTGALHEDGLADCVDGFWGGRTRERRLEIMKDSRIGSYGALALCLFVLIRWSSLSALEGWALPVAMAAAGMLSRAPMALAMALMPPARPGGLSASVGVPPLRAGLAGAFVAAAGHVALAGPAALAPPLAAAGGALAVALLARARLGGQTGDVLGAMQQVAEAASLAAFAARP